MKCPNCGFEAGENDKFCIGCGTRLTAPETPVEAPVPEVPEAAEVPEKIEEAIENAAPATDAAAEKAEKAAEEVKEAVSPVIPTVVPAEPVEAKPFVEAKPVVEPAPAPIPVKIEYKDDEECAAPTLNKLNKPLSVWGYIWRIILFSLPILNIIPLFVMAFSKGINRNSKHFASAVLVLMLIGLIISVGVLVYLLITTDPAAINQFFGNLFGKN